MNYKRIGRALVCLLLVCCLIVNVSPVRAKAVTATATVVGVSAVTVAASLMLGLGVLPGSDVNVFTSVANTISTNLQASGWVQDGKINLYKLNDAAYTWGVPIGVIDATREALRDNDYYDYSVNSATFLPAGTTLHIMHKVSSRYEYTLPTSIDCYGFYIYYNDSLNLVLYSRSSTPTLNKNGSNLHAGSTLSSSFYYIQYFNQTPLAWNPVVTFCYFTDSNNYASFSDAVHACIKGSVEGAKFDYSSSYDLSMGELAPDSASFADGYSTWASNAITVPGTAGDGSDDVVVVPIGNPTSPDVTTQTQTDIWNGVTSTPDVGDDDDVGVIPPAIEGGSTTITPADGLTGTLSETGAQTFLDAIGAFFAGWLDAILEWLEALWELISSGFISVVDAIAALPAAFSSWLEKILEWLAKIWEAIKAIPGLIADAIANVLSLAFAVSDTFIATKVEALTLKYPYLETFTGLGTSLKAFFLNLGSKPPIIYIDLGAATGSYFFGGRQAFIDLTWYSDYKPTMDAILGAFIWLWLAWRVFHALPGIINGMSGTVGERVSYSGTQNINLPPLPPQNELPPGHNRRM